MSEAPKSGGDAADAVPVYEVRKGDTLSKIAKQVYGDAALSPRIYIANREALRDPNRIEVGQKLRIP
jgi:nucleoid-associated protein YgaU